VRPDAVLMHGAGRTLFLLVSDHVTSGDVTDGSSSSTGCAQTGGSSRVRIRSRRLRRSWVPMSVSMLYERGDGWAANNVAACHDCPLEHAQHRLAATEAVDENADRSRTSVALAEVVDHFAFDPDPLSAELEFCTQRTVEEKLYLTASERCIAVLQESNSNVLVALNRLAHELLDCTNRSTCPFDLGYLGLEVMMISKPHSSALQSC